MPRKIRAPLHEAVVSSSLVSQSYVRKKLWIERQLICERGRRKTTGLEVYHFLVLHACACNTTVSLVNAKVMRISGIAIDASPVCVYQGNEYINVELHVQDTWCTAYLIVYTCPLAFMRPPSLHCTCTAHGSLGFWNTGSVGILAIVGVALKERCYGCKAVLWSLRFFGTKEVE